MALKLPEAAKPLANLVLHIAIGAALFGAMILIEVLLAGFLQLVSMIPFFPHWLDYATDVLEQGLFMFDVLIVSLFLIAELIKLVIGFWSEIRNGKA